MQQAAVGLRDDAQRDPNVDRPARLHTVARPLPGHDWSGAEPPAHTHAFVFLIEFGRAPKAGEPGTEWISGTNVARTDLRCTELAVVITGYVRALGWSARGHVAGDGQEVDIERLAQRAGVVTAVDGVLAMPFSKRGFRIGVVTTD